MGGGVKPGTEKTPIEVGTRFDRLVVTGPAKFESDGKRHVYYYPCRCDCGMENEYRKVSLKSGKCTSCGCKSRERGRETGKHLRSYQQPRPLNVIPVGTRFGLLTIIGPATRDTRTTFPCRCDCGAEVRVFAGSLSLGVSESCGSIACMYKVRRGVDVGIGSKWGKLAIIGPPFPVRLDSGIRMSYVVCECECGNVVAARLGKLVAGECNSCSCGIREAVTTHGLFVNTRRPPHYGRWCGMRRRCYDKNSGDYKRYGGRGIKVCNDWKNSFEAFSNWANTVGFEEGQYLDRIDVNGDYCPENCRFISRKESARNKTTSKLLTAFGETKCLSEWVDDIRCRVKEHTLRARIDAGWSTEEAITMAKNGTRSNDDSL